MSCHRTVPVVQEGPVRDGLTPTAKVYACRWALSASEVPVDGHWKD